MMRLVYRVQLSIIQCVSRLTSRLNCNFSFQCINSICHPAVVCFKRSSSVSLLTGLAVVGEFFMQLLLI